ncbi:cytochrome C biogenesis protein [Candidatus Woesearchaeota archaeon]|nr:cytochrome C biogenesis protein [Candidatus Woesearchaeota archaeon]
MTIGELALSFGLGIAANLNPCVLPLYPGYISYMASKPGIKNKLLFTRLSGLLVLAGVLIFMLLVAGIIAAIGGSINNFVENVSPWAFGVLIILGFILLFNVDIGKYFQTPKTPLGKNPYLSTLIFGFFYGPIVIPCNAPLVFAVFAFGTSVGGFLNLFIIFLAFGLGLGVPLLALSLISAAKGQLLIQKTVKYHTPINRVAGALLILLGLYELIFVFRIFGGYT